MHADWTTTKYSEEFLVLCGMGLGLAAILSTAVVIVTVVMALYHRRTKLDEMEATLKIEMIERGMSADDIVRVLKTHMEKRDVKNVAQRFRDRAAAGAPATG